MDDMGDGGMPSMDGGDIPAFDEGSEDGLLDEEEFDDLGEEGIGSLSGEDRMDEGMEETE